MPEPWPQQLAAVAVAACFPTPFQPCHVALEEVAAEERPLVAAEEAARDDREVVEADHETALLEARELE